MRSESPLYTPISKSRTCFLVKSCMNSGYIASYECPDDSHTSQRRNSTAGREQRSIESRYLNGRGLMDQRLCRALKACPDPTHQPAYTCRCLLQQGSQSRTFDAVLSTAGRRLGSLRKNLQRRHGLHTKWFSCRMQYGEAAGTSHRALLYQHSHGTLCCLSQVVPSVGPASCYCF